VARAAAATIETVWKVTGRKGAPPLTRFAVWVSSQECTIDTTKAREELGYRPLIKREEGMEELRADAA
jgi:nucleoside-diphosphate-sugar epimerase